MAKQLLYAEEARTKLKAGVDKLASAVATTLGPKGRNVALDKKWGAPNVVHDGVSVAKEIELEDPFENMGASLVKEAASKTSDVAGDGTTTATVLARAMVEEGLKNITAGANPMVIKRGVEKATEAVVAELKKMAKKVKDQPEIEKIATISAADGAIGKMIAEALQKVGPDGVITVEEGKGLELSVEYKEGMEFDRGFVSAYFVTDPDKMQSVIEDAHILITDQKVSSLNDLLQFLEKFVKVSKSLVIIADEVEGEALATLVVNKLKGSFNVLAIKAPGFGDRRKEMLEDISVLTGGVVAQVNVGAATEIELNEKKERVKDAVGATKAAIEEGILPGGGVALLRASFALKKVKTDSEEEKVGISILEYALEQPIRKLALNCGEDPG